MYPGREVAASARRDVLEGDDTTTEAQGLRVLLDPMVALLLHGSLGGPGQSACWPRRGRAPQEPYRASIPLPFDEGGTSV